MQAWRKSKRAAEDSSGGRGGALSKRTTRSDREVLEDITNDYMLLADRPDRVVTRSSLRAAQAQVGPPAVLPLACMRVAACGTLNRSFQTQQSCHGLPGAPGGEASQRWAAPRVPVVDKNAMVLSPAGTTPSMAGLSERLSAMDRPGEWSCPSASARHGSDCPTSDSVSRHGGGGRSRRTACGI